MAAAPRRRRSYDPRLRLLVHNDGADDVVRRLGIPRSTVAGWKRTPPPRLVTTDVVDLNAATLQTRVARLERRIKVLTTTMVLLLTLVRVLRIRLDRTRVPDGEMKAILLRAVERVRTVLPLRSALRILGLSASRHDAWRRIDDRDCKLDDTTTCPRTRPTGLTATEVWAMQQIATAPEHRHVPTSVLAVLAQRLGKVFASPATWCRYVRDRAWRRPRKRIHPCAPKQGLRTDTPDAMWHHDTTVIRLIDGKKVYLRAVIDNFSRRILAWWVGTGPEPKAAAALLLKAAQSRADDADNSQSVMVDGGVENFNDAVDKLVNNGVLKRILAQTDITASNSMIEAFFRIAKHNWLFLNELNSLAAVRRLSEFYIKEYNSTIPHSALGGRTPDEVYFGNGEHIPVALAGAKKKARQDRLDANRARACDACRTTTSKTVNA